MGISNHGYHLIVVSCPTLVPVVEGKRIATCRNICQSGDSEQAINWVAVWLMSGRRLHKGMASVQQCGAGMVTSTILFKRDRQMLIGSFEPALPFQGNCPFCFLLPELIKQRHARLFIEAEGFERLFSQNRIWLAAAVVQVVGNQPMQ